jgi:hypothetical protein
MQKHLVVLTTDASKAKFDIYFTKFLLLCYWMAVLVGLPESALVDESGVFP